ncbi:hypothetical protein OUZ56_003968 [Daphnia magna]|uniref:Uncharacterized protein n=1 Tax=Daphnia magna TaxID=35525 RepID=A0ABQ9YNC5_9CRUS|nr:hypothetical protein OUZ56_003968 [Daphnia magna]
MAIGIHLREISSKTIGVFVIGCSFHLLFFRSLYLNIFPVRTAREIRSGSSLLAVPTRIRNNPTPIYTAFFNAIQHEEKQSALQSTENIHEIERERERSAFARTKSKAAAGGCQCGVGRNPAPHHLYAYVYYANDFNVFKKANEKKGTLLRVVRMKLTV